MVLLFCGMRTSWRLIGAEVFAQCFAFWRVGHLVGAGCLPGLWQGGQGKGSFLE